MRKKPTQLIFLLFLLAIITSPISIFGQVNTNNGKGVGNRKVSKLPSESKRWALIIGVDNYRDDISQLYGSVNDAKALREVLVRNAGFPEKQVILMTTDSNDRDLIPNRGNILFALDKLSRQVPEDGLLLFSFSGHGISVGKDAFLIPSDGRIYSNPELLRDGSIDVTRVKKAIERTKATQVLMLLDACRNEPLKGKGDAPNPLTEAYSKGFSFETRNKGINAFATIYATSFGERAFEFYDKKTRQYRGFFSYAIEEALKGKAANNKGEITLGGLIDYIEKTVKKRVYVEKNQQQVPYPIMEGFGKQLILAIGGKYKKTTAEIAWERFHGVAKQLLKYEKVNEFSEGLASVSLDGKWGFINKKGNEIIPTKYQSVLPFSEDVAWVTTKFTNGYKIIDKNGIEFPTPNFGYIESFSKGMAKVELKGKYGFVDKTGEPIIPLRYEYVGDFSENLVWVKINNKYGFVDRFGKEVVTPKYEDIEGFSDGLAKVVLTDKNEEGVGEFDSPLKYGFIDKKGKLVISLKFYDAESFSEGLAAVFDGRKWGFINNVGKVVVSLKYDQVFSFSEGLAGVCIDKNCGFINKFGKVVIPLKYDYSPYNNYLYSGGIVRIHQNGKEGFLNKYGKEITPIIYDDYTEEGDCTDCFEALYEGRAIIHLNDKIGFINSTGTEVIKPKYDIAFPFFNKITQVGLLNRTVQIDSSKNYKFKFGYVDRFGKEVVPVKYNEFWCKAFIEEGFIGVKLNGKKGFVDFYGNEYFDF